MQVEHQNLKSKILGVLKNIQKVLNSGTFTIWNLWQGIINSKLLTLKMLKGN